MFTRSCGQSPGVRLAAALAVIVSLVTSAVPVIGGPGGMASILWLAPSRQSLAIQRQLNFVGSVTADSSTEVDARSPADVFLLRGTVSVDLLIQTLLSAYKDDRYGGIRVKRGANGEIQITNDTSLPGGTVQIDRGAQGIVVLHRLQRPGREQLLELITPLLP